MVENQCGASDMPQSTAAKVVVRDRSDEADRGEAAQPRRAGAGRAPPSCWRDQELSSHAEQAPDREVEDRAGGEEGHVQVGRLLLEQLVGGHDLGLRPGVERGGAEHDRDEEERHRRQRAGGRLVEAARHEAPEAAGEVVAASRGRAQPTPMPTQNRKPKRYERKNCPRSRAKPAARASRKSPPTARPRLQPLERGSSDRAASAVSTEAHRWCSGAGAAARLASSSACLSAGTSAAGAYWLNCSVRM